MHIEQLADRLETLRLRVSEQEQEVNHLSAEIQSEIKRRSASPGTSSLEIQDGPEAIRVAVEAAFKQLGPLPEPIGAEKVQRLIAADLAAHGIKPDDNALSTDIIAMREGRG